ncbi:phosphoglucomutase-1-like isoform X2 [Phymastichus coffea]|uniref:phosphoglucomutase-1-like isoform X2 n=1 Tax=Phymastichus coffea TaxID=108790 RepID=UPI00273BDFA2|nr:phosphoglucomutase-1-like isoform X2 [Phymastichus coffea]
MKLGVSDSRTVNCVPKDDFGGLHPDPNLIYAADLINAVKNGPYAFEAAFDGDRDRNMIIGKKAFFDHPSNSLAVLTTNLKVIPYFIKTRIKGCARSMSTYAAIDRFR